MRPPVRVALVGAHGFGRVHRERLARLEAEGTARLVGVVDRADPPAQLRAIHHRSLADLLASTDGQHRPEVVVIATPIDTHVPLAREALAAGCEVYLEKPPVPALSDHQVLLDAAREAGRSIQVGFQARGGAGIDQLRELVTEGALGEVAAVQVHGAWTRDRAYYQRSPWAGKRRLEGRRVADGVATNPLAHGVHAGLVIAGIRTGADIAAVTCELRRAHDIEADDTAFLRIDPAGDGPPVVCALTTTAPQQHAPWIEISGPGGSARLFYTEDRIRHTTAEAAVSEQECVRTDLMENLLAHVRDRTVELISPLSSTGAFSTVLEAVQSVPDPLPIDPRHIEWRGEGPAAHPVVRDIEQALARALDERRPFSHSGAAWARQDAVHVWRPPTAPER